MNSDAGRSMAPTDVGVGEDTVLGPSLRLEGVISAEEAVTIRGRLKGRVEVPAHLVVVSSGADVEADIKACRISIAGKVRGNVQGLDHVELTETADLAGQLQTREIRVEDGAVFRGRVDIVTDKRPPKG